MLRVAQSNVWAEFEAGPPREQHGPIRERVSLYGFERAIRPGTGNGAGAGRGVGASSLAEAATPAARSDSPWELPAEVHCD